MTDSRPTLLLGFHNHQPVGNFDDVIGETVDNAYLPFLEVANRFPDVRFSLHNTGCLWEWLDANRPDYIDTLKPLLARGQVELLGGGFYEPILPGIPRRDRVGQIRRMQDYLADRFGQRPRGMWLAERVWEQSLVPSLSEAGVEYLAVDDFHFGLIGLPPEDLRGYYLAEDEERTVALFPIDMELRYLTPFQMIERVDDYLRRVASEPEPHRRVLTIWDDGEKFGAWPGTHKWVYEEKWLERFFEYLSAADCPVRLGFPAEVVDALPPLGTVYLPAASYQEMGVWALPPRMNKQVDRAVHEAQEQGRGEEAKRLYNVAPWRNFFVRYPESNLMQKRAAQVSRWLDEARGNGHMPAVQLDRVEQHLHRSQCNCAYWHGVFGGLYLPHLRRGVYGEMIRAERLLYEHTVGKTGEAFAHTVDVDCDGIDDIVVRTKAAAFWLDPGEGGTLIGWDLGDGALNLLSTLARREEAYHDAPVAEDQGDTGHATIHDIVRTLTPKQKESLVYDPCRRAVGHDRIFLGGVPGATDLRLNRALDAADLWSREYQPESTDPSQWTLTGSGIVRHGEHGLPVTVRKTFAFDGATGSFTLSVRITLDADAPAPLVGYYAPEINLGLFSGDDPDRHYRLPDGATARLRTDLALDAAPELTVRSIPERLTVRLTVPGEKVAWRAYPVETISQSERGFETNFQSACLLPLRPINLYPSDSAESDLCVMIERD